jgi:hypothetical protein
MHTRLITIITTMASRMSPIITTGSPTTITSTLAAIAPCEARKGVGNARHHSFNHHHLPKHGEHQPHLGYLSGIAPALGSSVQEPTPRLYHLPIDH